MPLKCALSATKQYYKSTNRRSKRSDSVGRRPTPGRWPMLGSLFVAQHLVTVATWAAGSLLITVVLFAALTVVRFSLVTIALLASCVYVVWQVTHREKRAKELSTTREQAMVRSGAGRPPVRLPFFSSELARFRLMLCPGHNFSNLTDSD
jgi:hypothetical protein